MTTTLVNATFAAPGCTGLRATAEQQRQMDEHQLLVQTCQWCKTTYVNVGAAWRCEHWHKPLP